MTPFQQFAEQARKMDLHSVGRALFLSSRVGLVAGSGAIVFQDRCQAGQHFFLDAMAGNRPLGPAGESALYAHMTSSFRPWMIPVVAGLRARVLRQEDAEESST